MLISVMAEQPENAYDPIVVTVSEISMLVNPIQFWNAELPMDVTPLGMVISVRAEQPENAEDPMDVTVSGISILVKPVQL